MGITDYLQNLHIDRLSPMQEQVLSFFSRGNGDLLLLSPTGSGKTIAYLLSVLTTMKTDEDSLQTVVILPTRELCNQSLDVLNHMKTPFRGFSSHGGRSTMEEHRTISQQHPHIIFGTPGKLLDHLQKSNFDVSAVRYIVLDEFDKCLQMGFENEMQQLMRLLPTGCRHILLSATDTDVAAKFLRLECCKRIDAREDISHRLRSYWLRSETADKLPLLCSLLLSLPETASIVFVNYRESVERIFDELCQQGFEPAMYHGGMEQKDRERSLYKFMNGSRNVLVCTDIASRGLDFQQVDNIIHYHTAESPEVYLHRVGRTARWDKTGQTFHLLGANEPLPPFADADTAAYVVPAILPEPSQPKMQTIYVGKGKKDKTSKKDIVGFLCKNADMTMKDIGRIDLFERFAYVAVSRPCLKRVLQVSGQKIKGQRVLLEIIN